MKHLLPWFLAVGLTVMAGCSSNDGTPEDGAKHSGGHIWQSQEDAYKKAQKVGPMMDEADRRQRDLLEQQGG